MVVIIPNVSGTWQIVQSNGYFVDVEIRQDGGDISGSAYYSPLGLDLDAGPVPPPPLDERVSSMEAHGTLNDTLFSFAVDWDNGTRGQYNGYFEQDGSEFKLSGTTFNTEDPAAGFAGWYTESRFGQLFESEPGDGSSSGSSPTPPKTSKTSQPASAAVRGLAGDASGGAPGGFLGDPGRAASLARADGTRRCGARGPPRRPPSSSSAT